MWTWKFLPESPCCFDIGEFSLCKWLDYMKCVFGFWKFYSFLKRGKGRQKVRESKINVWFPIERPLLAGPHPWQLRDVPWLQVQPPTLWFVGPNWIHWASPSRALKMCFLFQCNGAETFWVNIGVEFYMFLLWIYFRSRMFKFWKAIQSMTSTNCAFIHSYRKCMQSAVLHCNKVFISSIFLNLTSLQMFIVLCHFSSVSLMM